ncbi:unnamed protein product [Litomosoides sigmodontis]|uniref:Innexin n=1 Tax=Litomosoides sigmodontis TaxID=42156 RepID=A0A3P6SUP0_LITSI|nr:unnamed protein product [Litomosoides sigmodontis]
MHHRRVGGKSAVLKDKRYLRPPLDLDSMIRNFDRYLQSLKPKYDDDVVDRCNYLVTNIMLLICVITVAAKQYVGEPLQCWIPAEFQNGWEQYIENFCFVENTYFVAFPNDIPADATRRNQYHIHYYQWIPFILTLQALLFLVPRTIWTTFNWRTGTLVFWISWIKYASDRRCSNSHQKNGQKAMSEGKVEESRRPVCASAADHLHHGVQPKEVPVCQINSTTTTNVRHGTVFILQMLECAEYRHATLPAESFPRNAILLLGLLDSDNFCTKLFQKFRIFLFDLSQYSANRGGARLFPALSGRKGCNNSAALGERQRWRIGGS